MPTSSQHETMTKPLDPPFGAGPMSRLELDDLAKGGKKNQGLDMHAVCHFDAGLRAVYHPGTGMVHLTCAACQASVVDLAVAQMLPTATVVH